jgi:hypothetical protein
MALHHLTYIVVNLSNERCLKKSNQIKSNQIKSNQIKSNQIKSNQIKSNQSLVMETQNMMVAADNLY